MKRALQGRYEIISTTGDRPNPDDRQSGAQPSLPPGHRPGNDRTKTQRADGAHKILSGSRLTRIQAPASVHVYINHGGR